MTEPDQKNQIQSFECPNCKERMQKDIQRAEKDLQRIRFLNAQYTAMYQRKPSFLERIRAKFV